MEYNRDQMLRALTHCLESNSDDIARRVDFTTRCTTCLVQHGAEIAGLFCQAIEKENPLGSFRHGAGHSTPVGPGDHRFLPLVGCCVTFGPRKDAKAIAKTFVKNHDQRFGDLVRLHGVCNNRAWTQKQKLVVLDIREERDAFDRVTGINLTLVAEDQFTTIFAHHFRETPPPTECEDFLQDPAALCGALYGDVDDAPCQDSIYSIPFYADSAKKPVGHADYVDMLGSIQGTVTKLVTLTEGNMRILKDWIRNAKPKKPAAVKGGLDTSDKRSFNKTMADNYGSLVPKPGLITFQPLYLALAQAASQGVGWASSNPMREVYKAIGAERLKSLEQDQIAIHDLPDLTERYNSLMLQHCPQVSDEMKRSRCIALMREHSLFDLKEHEICFREFQRIDELVEAYMADYRRPRQTWDGVLSVHEFSAMIQDAVKADALPPPAEPLPYVADDWMDLLRVILFHISGGHSLDTVHVMLALASHPVLRVIPRADLRTVCYFAHNCTIRCFRDVLRDIVKELRGYETYAILASIDGYLESKQVIPEGYQPFLPLDEAAFAGEEEEDLRRTVRRSGRPHRNVKRLHVDFGPACQHHADETAVGGGVLPQAPTFEAPTFDE